MAFAYFAYTFLLMEQGKEANLPIAIKIVNKIGLGNPRLLHFLLIVISIAIYIVISCDGR